MLLMPLMKDCTLVMYATFHGSLYSLRLTMSVVISHRDSILMTKSFCTSDCTCYAMIRK